MNDASKLQARALEIVSGVSLRLADGSEPALYVSQPQFWDTRDRPDGAEGAAAISLDEFLAERHHSYYGRPWVLGRYYFDHLISRGLRPSDRVLDLGCGAGRVGIHLIPYLQQSRYFGIDSHLRSLLAFAAYEAFINALGPKKPQLMYDAAFDVGGFNETFDVVLDFYVTHHLEIPAVEEAYKKIGAVTLPGARIFLSHAPTIGIEGMERLGFAHTGAEDVSYPFFAASAQPILATDRWHEFIRADR